MESLEILNYLFTYQNILAVVAGVFIGILIGMLPGLTANLGVALLLPVTYGLEPTSALLLLVSVYTSAIYGGSFPAILINAPGTSASAATALDGYVLTQKGQFNLAIRVSTFASVFGGMISGFALLFIAPPLSLISLKFGPAQYFMLAIFGLTIIGTLSSGNFVKGLIAGSIGLFLSTIGTDLDSGYPRFTFGFSGLLSGINFVPAVIGLFSFSQALILSEDPNKTIQLKKIKTDAWHFLPKLIETQKVFLTCCVSSLIGVLVGILPGAGGDIASWVSYNEAKRFSKNKSEFGKGSLKGIAASECANNAVTGSALIPLLTLGIPGSTTAAILLGALLIHGLLPGRELFTTNGNITYSVIWGFIFANFLMGMVGLFVAKYFGKIAKIPNYFLAPSIIVLSVVGSYAIGNNLQDVYTMVIFGLAGYLMKKLNYPPAPLILGLILGPIAETGFRQSQILAKDSVLIYILNNNISLILFILTIVSILSAIYLEITQKVNYEKNIS
jgi:putative tricarboxylic transport membrane protein